MSYVQQFITAVSTFFLGDTADTYVPIAATGKIVDATGVVPQELYDVAKELKFGNETERLVRMAMRVHPEPVNQVKWLRAIPVLRRSTRKKWIMDEPVAKAMVPIY